MHDADSLRDEKAQVFKAIRTASPADLVRGQYRGYRGEAGVARRLERRDLRRAAAAHRLVALGRRAVLLALRQVPRHDGTEVVVDAEAAAARKCSPTSDAPNYLRFRLGPTRVAIALGASAKRPGAEMRGRDVELFVCNTGPEEAAPTSG